MVNTCQAFKCTDVRFYGADAIGKFGQQSTLVDLGEINILTWETNIRRQRTDFPCLEHCGLCATILVSIQRSMPVEVGKTYKLQKETTIHMLDSVQAKPHSACCLQSTFSITSHRGITAVIRLPLTPILTTPAGLPVRQGADGQSVRRPRDVSVGIRGV